MIPNRFHFVFGLRKQVQPFHLAHYLCLESCRQVNRPEAIHFYYHHEPYGPYWDLIRPHLDLVRVAPDPMVASFTYRDAAIRPFRYAHHADFIRLEQLVASGGIYADIDTIFVRPLRPDLFQRPFVMGRESAVWNPKVRQYAHSLCNAFMMSQPGAPFGRAWLDQMRAAFDGTWSNHSTLLPQRLSERHPDWIHIEPHSSFFHYPASPSGLSLLFDDNQPIPPQVLSIHLWAHLWWNRRRTDFSTFHEGLITERFIRDADTVFSSAARPYLPPAAIRSGTPSRQFFSSWTAAAAADRWQQTASDTRALAGLVAIPLIRRVSPGFGRLHLARAHWTYRRAQRRFDLLCNPFEKSILRWVIQWDEYGIFGENFCADSVIVDVGAHVGSFSFACHALKSRNIHAFEPFPANFRRLTHHLSGLPGISCYQQAVFRSDRPVPNLVHSGPLFSNTGGGNVMFHGRSYNSDTAECSTSISSAATVVPTIALDDILERLPRVDLLKVDCEGSEFPILLTSRLLRRVDRIVGEYHEVTPAEMHMLAPEARLEGVDAFTIEVMAAGLKRAGFAPEFRSTVPGRGFFQAARID
jgi:FkbM family methyltransferase